MAAEFTRSDYNAAAAFVELYPMGKHTAVILATLRLAASASGKPGGETPAISPMDPAMIIAGIRQFGLAPDGSDLRDLDASIARLSAPPGGEMAGEPKPGAWRWSANPDGVWALSHDEDPRVFLTFLHASPQIEPVYGPEALSQVRAETEARARVAGKLDGLQAALDLAPKRRTGSVEYSNGVQEFIFAIQNAWRTLRAATPSPHPEGAGVAEPGDDLEPGELKPCPFCGGEAERITLDDRGRVIQCAKCMASSPVHFDRAENLDDSWNRRAAAPPAPLPPAGQDLPEIIFGEVFGRDCRIPSVAHEAAEHIARRLGYSSIGWTAEQERKAVVRFGRGFIEGAPSASIPAAAVWGLFEMIERGEHRAEIERGDHLPTPLPTLPEGGGWLPMETAPKDGAHILVGWSDRLSPPTVAHWFVPVDDNGPMGDGGWYLSVQQNEGPAIDPTHWQPAPSEPKPEEKGS